MTQIDEINTTGEHEQESAESEPRDRPSRSLDIMSFLADRLEEVDGDIRDHMAHVRRRIDAIRAAMAAVSGTVDGPLSESDIAMTSAKSRQVANELLAAADLLDEINPTDTP